MHSIQKNTISIQKAENSVEKVTFYNAKFGQNYSDEREPFNNKNKPNTDEI